MALTCWWRVTMGFDGRRRLKWRIFALFNWRMTASHQTKTFSWRRGDHLSFKSLKSTNANICNFQKKVPFKYQTMTHFWALTAAQCVRTQLKPFNYGFNQTFAPSSWNVVMEGGGLVFLDDDHITHSCHLWLASKQINLLASIFTTQFIMPFHEIRIM